MNKEEKINTGNVLKITEGVVSTTPPLLKLGRGGERGQATNQRQPAISEFAGILVEFLVGDVPTLLTLVKEFVQVCKGRTLGGFN